MDFIYKSKLFKQLTGVIGLLVLLAIGIPSVFAIVFITPKVVEDRYHRIMQSDVAFLANRLDWHLQKSIRDVEFLSKELKLSDIKEASEKIDLFVKSSPIFTGGVITDIEGNIVLFYSSPQGLIKMKEKHNIAEKEYIKQPLASNCTYLSNVITTDTNPSPLIFVSRAITEGSENTGVLALTINLRNEENIFSTLFNYFREKKQGNIYVIDNLGKIIYHWDKEKVGSIIDSVISDSIADNAEGIIEKLTLYDTKKAVAYSHLERNNWSVIYEIEHEEIYSISKIGRYMTFGTMLLVLLLGLVASSVFVKIILKPLADITAATEQVAAGDFSRQIENKGHKDFLPLIKNFNIMIKNLRFQYEELEKLSLEDYQTGLANRRYFELQLIQELKRSIRLGHDTTLMILDIDKFKEINDRFGHLTGDKAIVALAEALKGSVRSLDLPVRYGGDEFVILLPETNISQGEVVGKKIQETVKEISLNTRKGNTAFTVSIGLVSIVEGGSTSRTDDEAIQEIMRRADIALYQAKKNGRNRIEQYQEV